MPRTSSVAATIQRMPPVGTTRPDGRRHADGGRDGERVAQPRAAARRPTPPGGRCSCSPSATANSQPMPGLSPWTAPSSASAAHGHAVGAVMTGSRTNRTRRRRPASRTWCGRMPSSISTMNRGSSAIPPFGSASSLTIQPRIPSGIELRVPRRVERVGEVHPPAVAAHLDHLRRAVERPVGRARMRRAPHDAADPRRAGEHRLERIAHVVLPELARAPARHVEEPVVQREVDVGHQRRHRLESLEQRRQVLGGRGLGRDLDHLLHLPARRAVGALAVPHPDGRREILERDHHAHEAVALRRVVRRPELEHHLLLGRRGRGSRDGAAAADPTRGARGRTCPPAAARG